MLAIACADDIQDVSDEGPQIKLVIDVSSYLEPNNAPLGSVPVAAGLFMSVSQVRQAEAIDRARQLVAATNATLAQCGLHLDVEAAQVIAMPQHLGIVQGNEPGSWGGHSPDSLGDPDLVTYHYNERLTSDTRELFAYGKRYVSPNAIAIFVVDGIEFYIDTTRVGAGGLSFPPVAYHHPDDYPLRNSVLVKDASGIKVAHELGHMLLNTGDHWGGGRNLMLGPGGTDLTPDQCDRMHDNHEGLFGSEAVADPGPPTTGATAIAMVSGDQQVGKAGEVVQPPFVVRVTDALGEGVRHVHVFWRVTSGGGHMLGRPASRTGVDGLGEMSFVPTAIGTSIVTANVMGLDGSPVTFSIDAPIMVMTLQRATDLWTGAPVGAPHFLGPGGDSLVTVPVETTVEWLVGNVETAHITSKSVPAGGTPFDSGGLAAGERVQVLLSVVGAWEFEDQISGATATITAQ